MLCLSGGGRTFPIARPKWGYSIADLLVLLSVALQNVIVREALEPSCFSNGQGPALHGVVVDVVVAILTDV